MVCEIQALYGIWYVLNFIRIKEVMRSMISVWKRGIATNCDTFICTGRKRLDEMHQRTSSDHKGKLCMEKYVAVHTCRKRKGHSERERQVETYRQRERETDRQKEREREGPQQGRI